MNLISLFFCYCKDAPPPLCLLEMVPLAKVKDADDDAGLSPLFRLLTSCCLDHGNSREAPPSFAVYHQHMHSPGLSLGPMVLLMTCW